MVALSSTRSGVSRRIPDFCAILALLVLACHPGGFAFAEEAPTATPTETPSPSPTESPTPTATESPTPTPGGPVAHQLTSLTGAWSIGRMDNGAPVASGTGPATVMLTPGSYFIRAPGAAVYRDSRLCRADLSADPHSFAVGTVWTDVRPPDPFWYLTADYLGGGGGCSWCYMAPMPNAYYASPWGGIETYQALVPGAPYSISVSGYEEVHSPCLGCDFGKLLNSVPTLAASAAGNATVPPPATAPVAPSAKATGKPTLQSCAPGEAALEVYLNSEYQRTFVAAAKSIAYETSCWGRNASTAPSRDYYYYNFHDSAVVQGPPLRDLDTPDITPPAIVGASPSTAALSGYSDSYFYTVVFSEAVVGLTPSHFHIQIEDPDIQVKDIRIKGTGRYYEVTVDVPRYGNTTLHTTLLHEGIQDLSGNPLPAVDTPIADIVLSHPFPFVRKFTQLQPSEPGHVAVLEWLCEFSGDVDPVKTKFQVYGGAAPTTYTLTVQYPTNASTALIRVASAPGEPVFGDGELYVTTRPCSPAGSYAYDTFGSPKYLLAGTLPTVREFRPTWTGTLRRAGELTAKFNVQFSESLTKQVPIPFTFTGTAASRVSSIYIDYTEMSRYTYAMKNPIITVNMLENTSGTLGLAIPEGAFADAEGNLLPAAEGRVGVLDFSGPVLTLEPVPFDESTPLEARFLVHSNRPVKVYSTGSGVFDAYTLSGTQRYWTLKSVTLSPDKLLATVVFSFSPYSGRPVGTYKYGIWNSAFVTDPDSYRGFSTGARVFSEPFVIPPAPTATPSPSPSPTLTPSPSPTEPPPGFDSDGDGYSDLYETTMGTSPANPTDAPTTGDIDDDGEVTAVDAVELYRAIRDGSLSALFARQATSPTALDFNLDGAVTAADAIYLYRWTLGAPGYEVLH